MRILKNISLKSYNTFGIDCLARCMITVRSEKETVKLFSRDVTIKKPLLLLGGGSNILFTGDFTGTIIHPCFSGIRLEEHSGEDVIISAGSGIVWDKLVEWANIRGFGGIENLSLIPGQAGAAPIQNIGAYGVEVKDTLIKVKAISVRDGSLRFFSNGECSFGYRSSIFKTTEKNKYLVTRIWLRLKTKPVFNLAYGSLKEEVDKLGDLSLANVRQAVINLRKSKLPDPDVTGNAGSFFKNPVVEKAMAEDIRKEYPSVPLYEEPGGQIKLAAGWLIENCGWKGRGTGNAGVHDKQALVLVNLGNASGKEIYELSEKIRTSVSEKFGINLDREVQVTGII